MLESLAVAVRSERGNLAFEPWREEGTPGSFFVYEVYADEGAFAAHLASSHSVEFNALLSGHVAGGASELTTLCALT
jgi:quinol monooxygenase YgiN